MSDLLLLPGDEPRFAAAAGAAGVVLLSAEGQIIGAGETAERTLALAQLDGRVAVSLHGGQIVTFDVD